MADETVERLVVQWRARYADPGALELWRGCHPSEAQAKAFNIIAQTPALLKTAAPDAVRLAEDADAFCETLLARHKGNDWWAAAVFVRRAVTDWRRGQQPGATPAAEPAAPAASMFEGEHRHLWDAARRSFPRFDEATGRLMAETVLRLGDQLHQVRRPWDRVIALGAARFAADSARAPTAERGTARLSSPMPLPDVLTVLRLVSGYAEASKVLPMSVPFPSRHASSAQLALGLARDAFTLDDVAGAQGQPSTLWRQAANLNAFATIAIDRSLLMRVPMEEARRFARAALAYSAAAAADPDTAPMPMFSDGFCPAAAKVALDARSCLPR